MKKIKDLNIYEGVVANLNKDLVTLSGETQFGMLGNIIRMYSPENEFTIDTRHGKVNIPSKANEDLEMIKATLYEAINVIDDIIAD